VHEGVRLPALEVCLPPYGSPRWASGRWLTRQERGVSPSPSGRRDGGQGFAMPVAIAAGSHQCGGSKSDKSQERT